MRRQYSKKDIKAFLESHPYAGSFIDKKSRVVEEDEKLFVENGVCFRRHGDRWIPSLELLREHRVLPRIVVDKGTPPFILKGADLMRPGVVACDEFERGALVVYVDERHGFPLATGEALYASVDLMSRASGKVALTIHNLKQG